VWVNDYGVLLEIRREFQAYLMCLCNTRVTSQNYGPHIVQYIGITRVIIHINKAYFNDTKMLREICR